MRGFAVKFYTDEGNFDLVGNNMPVFFIQDAIKFPDLIHAVKPEPHNEIPQAASAHDTFWDFISLMPESMHMVMWLMSDRAIPRSYRMMEGFGVHTFRLVDAKGTSRFVKFHWKPLLGVHSVAWDEAQKISGKDPDFHRRDLWEAIEGGDFPEYELGLQIVEEKDEFAFGFDLLDPTKLIPEELVPVQRVGRLTLNRNPDNFFAETEQVAFHIGNVVPGIDFTNDPLLQGRLFSYPDTQLIRLGGPNFHEIPINRPIAPVRNNQRDGHHAPADRSGRVSYQPNSLGDNAPAQVPAAAGGYVTYPRGDRRRQGPCARRELLRPLQPGADVLPEPVRARAAAPRSRRLRFELGKVTDGRVRERMVAHLAQVDATLAVAGRQGSRDRAVPARSAPPPNLSVPADGDAEATSSTASWRIASRVGRAEHDRRTCPDRSPRRKVAILVAPGFDGPGRRTRRSRRSQREGAQGRLVGPNVGPIAGDDGASATRRSSASSRRASVLFDAVYVAGGEQAPACGRPRPTRSTSCGTPSSTARRSARTAMASSCWRPRRSRPARPMARIPQTTPRSSGRRSRPPSHGASRRRWRCIGCGRASRNCTCL